ncbi:MAG TPA: DUF2304 domain-containing protein [Thermoleophilaceae bacterium]
MGTRIQIVSIVATVALFVIVFELVRRRRLQERYALLWLFAAVVLFGLAAWQGLLSKIASAVGIFYPPSALFVIAFGFILVLLLHFSVAVSRLSDQTKVLAQRLALTEKRLRDLEAGAEPEVREEERAPETVGRAPTP